jgi:predicted nucleic acid-binding protein
MTAVFDVHILAAGLLDADGMAGRAVDLVRGGRVRLAADDRVLQEYSTVLRRPWFAARLGTAGRDRVLAFLRSDSLRCVCTQAVPNLPEPRDACYAESALAADVPLVTDDFRRFPAERCGRTRVFSLIRFLEECHRPV